jgi:hypothetical protein
MPEILDHQFLSELKKEQKKKSLFFWTFVFNWLKHSSVLLHAILIMSLVLLIMMVESIFPSFLGLKTIYGASQERLTLLDSAQHTVQQKNDELLTITNDLNVIQRLELPPSLQSIKNSTNGAFSFSTVAHHFYRLLEEVVPRNFMLRTVVISSFSFDPHDNTLIVEGIINNDHLTIMEGKLIGSGYSLAGYFLQDLNRSPYFKNGVLEEISTDTTNTNILHFRMHLAMQGEQEVDMQDSSENFLDYVQHKLQSDVKIKR